MDPTKINEAIEHFKTNGTYSLPDKDILLYLLSRTNDIEKKTDEIDKKIDNQVTFCKTHLAEKNKFFKSTSQIITWLLSIAAMCVAVYAIYH